MFILRDLLTPLQEQFSTTKQGQKRKIWFVYTLLAIITPFTSSMTSNLLWALNTLFGMDLKSQRYYTFMVTSTLPWLALWQTVWGLIPSPTTCGPRASTSMGLTTVVNVLDKLYQTGRKYAADFRDNMPILFDQHLSKWNYRAIPSG